MSPKPIQKLLPGGESYVTIIWKGFSAVFQVLFTSIVDVDVKWMGKEFSESRWSPLYPEVSLHSSISNDSLWQDITQIVVSFQVAYTFDAGPNACLFLMEKEVPEVLAMIHLFFPPDTYRG